MYTTERSLAAPVGDQYSTPQSRVQNSDTNGFELPANRADRQRADRCVSNELIAVNEGPITVLQDEPLSARSGESFKSSLHGASLSSRHGAVNE